MKRIKDAEVDKLSLGSRLRGIREYLGFSIEEVANVFNLPPSDILDMESGIRGVSETEIAKFSALYQQDILARNNDIARPDGINTDRLTETDQRELARFTRFLNFRKNG